jgi:hypothetical protein
MWIIKQDLRLLALRLAFTARSVERWGAVPTPVWGVELVGGPTDATALAAYRRLEQKYASILGDLSAHFTPQWRSILCPAANRRFGRP